MEGPISEQGYAPQQAVERTSETKRRALVNLCGGSPPDIVVVLGGGLTKGTETTNANGHPVLRERTSPYSGLLTTNDPQKTLASGVRPRVYAAATLHEYLDPENTIEYVTTGGKTRPKIPGNPYSGTHSSAIVMAHELEQIGDIPSEQVTTNEQPTNTATEVMEIVLHVAKRLKEGKPAQNTDIIASWYQTPRLQAFLQTVLDPEGLHWLLEAHKEALSQSDPIYRELLATREAEIQEAITRIQDHQAHITAISAEDALVYRSKRWEHIINDTLPAWRPWENRMHTDAINGLSDIQNRRYRFGKDATEEYLRACYPDRFASEEALPSPNPAKTA